MLKLRIRPQTDARPKNIMTWRPAVIIPETMAGI
jgi:hypothetical protein